MHFCLRCCSVNQLRFRFFFTDHHQQLGLSTVRVCARFFRERIVVDTVTKAFA